MQNKTRTRKMLGWHLNPEVHSHRWPWGYEHFKNFQIFWGARVGIISLNGGLWKAYPNLKGQERQLTCEICMESVFYILTVLSSPLQVLPNSHITKIMFEKWIIFYFPRAMISLKGHVALCWIRFLPCLCRFSVRTRAPTKLLWSSISTPVEKGIWDIQCLSVLD